MKARVKLTIAVLGVLIFALSGAVTVAHHTDSMYPTGNTFWACFDGSITTGFPCQTDNSSFTVYMESSLSVLGQARITATLNSQYDPTDLSVTFESSPSYSGGSETDVIYQHRTDFNPSADGIAWCDDAVDDTKCDQHYAAFRTDWPLEPLACHETGHTVGLMHGSLASPAISDTSSSLGCMSDPTASTALGTHNVTQINATY